MPPRQRSFARATLTLAWVVSALGGAAMVLFPIPSPFDFVTIVRTVSGAVLAVSSILAGLGVALNRYRIEWVSAWVSAAALAPYTLIYAYTVFSFDISRAAAAFFLASLVGVYVYRAIMCSAHAVRLRAIHEEELPHG